MQKVKNIDIESLPADKSAFTGIYDAIARAAGIDPETVEKYDCTKIDYSNDCQEALFEKLSGIAEPHQIAMALCMSGMKVDPKLAPRSAVIYSGGITLKS